jgi:L-lactate dehydrogenase
MSFSAPKVSIIGAGNVGTTFAFALMKSGLTGEIVLVDRNQKRAEGECMDLNHGMSFASPTKIYAGSYRDCAASNIVVVTAGAKQKAGQARLALVKENAEIFKTIIPEILTVAPETLLLIVSNPVDILTYVALKISGRNPAHVFGSGTVLDTSRLRFLLSAHCSVDPRNVHAYILGEHGDTELPAWSTATIGGMPLAKYCPLCNRHCDEKKELDAIFDEVKNAAYKIIEAKGATYYAIALALVRIVEAVLRDENSILPVSRLLEGYYGLSDVALSVPCLVNKKGAERSLRIGLSQEEQTQLKASASALRKVIHTLGL